MTLDEPSAESNLVTVLQATIATIGAPAMTKENPAIPLAGPARIARLILDRADDGLTITLRLLSEGASSPTEVRFLGASDVRFRGERTELKEIVFLVAEDISANGWEGIRYRVKDYEEEFISFVCREIEPHLTR